jgi:hypothetical protein
VRSLHNHYIWRLLWLHQPLLRNWVTEKVSLGYAKGVGWGVCTKSGICPSTWQIDTLGPLGDNCINESCKRVTRSRRVQCHETSWKTCQTRVNTIWRYRWSNLGQDLVSCDKGNGILRLRINKEFRGMHIDQNGFPELIVGYWSERGLDHVWRIPWPIGCNT